MKETDIVQALRCCAEGECKDCAMHEDKQRCQENLLDKAAEAIERMTAENAELREKQRWIPVTERMTEEIKAPFTEDAMINLAAQKLGVEHSRLRELAEADKDGKCVVLPCKVGQRVFALLDTDKNISECEVKQIGMGNEIGFIGLEPIGARGREYGVALNGFGKKAFLTREEAEKALEEKEGKKDG